MAVFNKSQYVTLASICRDMIFQGDHFVTEESDFCIETLARALEDDSPNGFDKPRFLHNIYCPNNHKEKEVCRFGYSPKILA